MPRRGKGNAFALLPLDQFFMTRLKNNYFYLYVLWLYDHIVVFDYSNVQYDCSLYVKSITYAIVTRARIVIYDDQIRFKVTFVIAIFSGSRQYRLNISKFKNRVDRFYCVLFVLFTVSHISTNNNILKVRAGLRGDPGEVTSPGPIA